MVQGIVQKPKSLLKKCEERFFKPLVFVYTLPMSDQKSNTSLLVAILIIIAVGVGAYFVITRTPDSDDVFESQDVTADTAKDDTTNTTNNTQGSMDTQPTEMKITTTQEGTGEPIKNGQTAVMNYTGTFSDGKVFDTNVGPNSSHPEPFEFVLGAGMVIQGWDKGILGMKVGEKRTLVIPSSLAYGPNDYGPIPGGSTLIFEVELTGIK